MDLCRWELSHEALQSALRQAVYLAIKELAPYANDVIMVTSSIMKDMSAPADVIYRPNSIRALCHIIDVRSFPSFVRLQTERLQALYGTRC